MSQSALKYTIVQNKIVIEKKYKLCPLSLNNVRIKKLLSFKLDVR